MEKSFYYEVDWQFAYQLKGHLSYLKIPFTIESSGEGLLFVFPDLPNKDYWWVYELFGGIGEKYGK